jgi:IclR family acetate operon transcriptional repressor
MASSMKKSHVKTARTTMRIIEAVREQNGGGVTEIADYLDMSKSNTYKYLNTLADDEHLVKDDGEYRIGLKFLDLGEHARNRQKIYMIAAPKIQELANETSETANLMIEEHGMGVFLLKADSSQAVNLDTHAGMRVYLHTTALGKAILAYLPQQRTKAIVERHGLPRMNENTITDRGKLFEELETIRERGYALDDEERLEGLRCVAAPVLTTDNTIIGAISVSGPTSRLEDERFRNTLPEKILKMKNVISLNVEYH